MSDGDYLVGLDLGQASDYTAWIVAERTESEERISSYDIRHIDRVRGAPYPQVVTHTRELIDALLATRAKPRPALVVDYTGVGRPVADMLIEAELNAEVRLVTITGGDAEAIGDRGERRVPKRNLAGTVQVLLQSGRLRISNTLPLASTLTEELVNFRVKIALNGHDSYGAGDDWRDGNHDDLVLALAMALWQGERTPRPVVVVPGSVVGGSLFSHTDSGYGGGWGLDAGSPWRDPWASE